jgi:hypothetical protein
LFDVASALKNKLNIEFDLLGVEEVVNIINEVHTKNQVQIETVHKALEGLAKN